MSQMMTTSFGLLFYLKKGRKTTVEEWPVYLRITVDGLPKEISIQRSCLYSRWNAETGRATGLKEEIRALNSYLDTIQSKVFEAKHRLIESGKPVTFEAIKRYIQGREEVSLTLLGQTEVQINICTSILLLLQLDVFQLAFSCYLQLW
jgi:hypothetical protein